LEEHKADIEGNTHIEIFLRCRRWDEARQAAPNEWTINCICFHLCYRALLRKNEEAASAYAEQTKDLALGNMARALLQVVWPSGEVAEGSLASFTAALSAVKMRNVFRIAVMDAIGDNDEGILRVDDEASRYHSGDPHYDLQLDMVLEALSDTLARLGALEAAMVTSKQVKHLGLGRTKVLQALCEADRLAEAWDWMQNEAPESYGLFGAALVRRGRPDQALGIAEHLPATMGESLGPIITASIGEREIDTTVQLLELAERNLHALAATASEVVALFPDRASRIFVAFEPYFTRGAA
jgi:hypothetical protein